MTTHRHNPSQLSPDGAIAKLMVMRSTIGAATATGRVISTVAEQREHMRTYVRPDWAKDDRQTLPYMLKQSIERLGG
jgi:hypothetical protein